MSEVSGQEFSVTYTAGSGFKDWLSAKWNRQPLFGAGEIEFAGPVLVLRGQQRTWLGVVHQAELIVPSNHVPGVWQEGTQIELLVKKPWRPSQLLRLRARSDADAAMITGRLPPVPTTGADVRDFQRRLRATGRNALVTPALVLLNLAVYAALIWATGQYGAFDSGTLEIWGANYGPDTAGGQWWRLITYTFLHGSLLHILINMWVLWSVGRLMEKLYGNAPFLLLYLAAGVMGGLLSIAWDPARQAIGASGAIFGVLGALLACLWRGRAQMPVAIFRAHWFPTLLFCLFSIVNGLFAQNVDNAAHIGGLAAGLLIGAGITKPLDVQGAGFRPDLGGGVALLGAAALAGGLFWFATGAPHTPIDNYLAARKWYSRGETPNLILWQQLAGQAASGAISGLDLSNQFESKVVPFWRMADARLKAEKAQVLPVQKDFDAKFRGFVSARRRWAEAIVPAAKSTSLDASNALFELKQKTDTVAADVERLEMRSNIEHRAHALSGTVPLVALGNLFWYGRRPCATYPFPGMNPVAPTDAAGDAPAIAKALGCQAQRLFLMRDFAGLDTLITAHESRLDDMPDGSSSLEAVMGGLDNLLSYGHLTIDQMMDRTAAWRRASPRSLYPELTEASALVSWAYYARGFGYANTISNQNLQLFISRLAMAASALQDIAGRGAGNPLWYEQSLTVGLLQSKGGEALRALFERGIARFPEHHALYSSMLHILMPRWGGSPADVGLFIEDQARHASDPDRANELYALLFFLYSSEEDDKVDIFQETGARWEKMRSGLTGLVARYPHTDVYANALAKFACEWQAWPYYQRFRLRYPAHYSAAVWSQTLSVAGCDAAAKAAKSVR